MKPSPQSAQEQIFTLRLLDGSANFAEQLDDWTPEKLPPRLANYLWALAVHYRRTNNAWLAVEAYKEMVASRLAPPAWVLDALAAGLEKHLQDPDGDLRQQMGLAKRGSGTTPPHDEFIKLKRLSGAMPDLWRLREQLGIPARAAAQAVIDKHDLEYAAVTLADKYRKHWARFYRALGYNPKKMTEEQRTKFLTSFPKDAYKIIQKALKS